MTTEPSANSFRAAIRSGTAGRNDDLVVSAKKRRLDRTAGGLTGVPVPRQEGRRSNQRGGDRHRLSGEAATIRVCGSERPVELINLSGGGAMVESDVELALWDRVELSFGENGVVECAVRWIRGKRVGLEFAHETKLDCPADERATVLREVIARSFSDISFESNEVERAETVERHPAPANEQRREARHPLIWTGELHHDYQTSPIRVRNISSTGAMLECGAPVRVGSEPLLELSDALSVSGTVTWAVGDHVGFRFHSPFDLGDLAGTRPDVAPTTWIRPAYLQSDDAPDSPWDPRWDRMSVSDLRQELEGYLKR
jgi:hypothetical protein